MILIRVFTSGKGSSAVGLTAYISKDPDTKELVGGRIEPGSFEWELIRFSNLVHWS